MIGGLITLHDAVNYGAALQTYAMLTTLNKFMQFEIIDYHMNTNEVQKHHGKLYTRTMNLLYLRTYLAYRRKRERFADFRKEYYVLSKLHYSGDREIDGNPPQYEVYVSGSDQIFNLELTNQSYAYFLGFARNKKKISYSSSVGMKGLGDKQLKEILPYLEQYQYISVREEEAQVKIEKALKRPVGITVDPVFLLTQEEWSIIAANSGVSGKYILVYEMSYGVNLKKALEWLKKRTGLPVVIVQGGTFKPGIRGKIRNDVGPCEFLELFKGAEYVLTNSFHGTAFSMIFGKKFMCFEQYKYPADKRYHRLFSETGIRIVPNYSEWSNFHFEEYMINGENAYKRIITWIDNSHDFIQKGIIQ